MYGATMPNAPKTTPRQMRIDSETWADFDEAAKMLGTDKSSLVREYIRWMLRRPGVKTPPRLTVEQAAKLAERETAADS
jgi:hypothetical protein